MRVLEAPWEVAGQVALTARALRLAGVDATALTQSHPFAYGIAADVVADGLPARLRAGTRLAARSDLVSLHFATSVVNTRFGHPDAWLLRRLGTPLLLTVWGSDARVPSVERARNPHYVPFEGEDDAVAIRRLRRWARLTDGHVVVPDPAMRAYVEPFFPHVHASRAIVDVSTYTAAPPSPDVQRPLLVHSPTERAGKGTVFVRRAVQALRDRGVPFEYQEVTGVPQPEALAIYGRADVIVDQLCVGSHGVFALEAMSMAKPVLCHIAQPELHHPDLPIVRADPDTVTEVLADLLTDPARRAALGRAGRAYVEHEHDVGVAGARLARIYAERLR